MKSNLNLSKVSKACEQNLFSIRSYLNVTDKLFTNSIERINKLCNNLSFGYSITNNRI